MGLSSWLVESLSSLEPRSDRSQRKDKDIMIKQHGANQRMLRHLSMLQCADTNPAWVRYCSQCARYTGLHTTLCTHFEFLQFWNCICAFKMWVALRFNFTDWYLWLWSFVPSSQKWKRLTTLSTYFRFKTLSFTQFWMAAARCYSGWNSNFSSPRNASWTGPDTSSWYGLCII